MRWRDHDPWALVAVGGLVALVVIWGLFDVFSIAGPLSLFPKSLTSPPLFWWPETSLFSVGVLFVLLFLMLPPAIAAKGGVYRPKHTALLLLMGTIPVAFAFAIDAQGGTALYPDRIVTRPAEFGAVSAVHPLAEVEAVEVGCTSHRRRGAEPIYTLVFEGGGKVWLEAGLGAKRKSAQWVRAIARIDETLRLQGTPRRVSRNIFDKSNVDAGCLEAFMQTLEPELRPLAGTLFEPLSVVGR